VDVEQFFVLRKRPTWPGKGRSGLDGQPQVQDPKRSDHELQRRREQMGLCGSGQLRCAPQDPSGLPRRLPLSEAPRQAWTWTSDCCRRPPPCGGQLLDPPQATTLSGSASKQDFVQERVSARHV
jgi:hypothetical protein